jgi:hypothetical protein
VHGDQPLMRTTLIFNDRDLAVEHDVEVVVLIALAEQHLPGMRAATRSLSLQARELILGEPGKGAVLVRCLDELFGRRAHGAHAMQATASRDLVRMLTGI